MRLLKLYADRILGAMKGLDRIRFRGTFRWLASERGIQTFMSTSNMLLKDFGRWAQAKTAKLRESCRQRAEELGIETIYLKSSRVDKEKWARKIAMEKGIESGSICMFSVVESCMAPAVSGNKATKKLELHYRPRKCVWIYHYFDDPELGFGHVRLQSWLPFNAYLCLNGRHWLEKQMEQRGMSYIKDGNCFPWIKDMEKAQEFLDAQLRTDWPRLLNRLTRETCPAMPEILSPLSFDYYWSADETEWATDVMFKSSGLLDELYPSFVRHAMIVSDSPSVMRFFGKGNISLKGKVKGRSAQEILSDCRRRYEGVRVKPWINRNSVKMYNKSGSVLRIETTINNTRDFKVYRSPEDDEKRPASWLPLRKGVSDLHRRCQVSDQSNERYADAVFAGRVEETLQAVASEACNPVKKSGKRYRALNPWDNHDFRLLTFLGKGELAVNGFRNKDLRSHLFPEQGRGDPGEAKRLSAKASRSLRLLRAHGLIRKVPKVNRYVLTEKGQKFSVALLGASAVAVQSLMEMAA